MAPTRTELIDLFWRSFWTFAASLIGNITYDGISNLTATSLKALAIAAFYSMLVTVVKTYISNKGGTGTATERLSAPVGLLKPVASNNATPAGT